MSETNSAAPAFVRPDRGRFLYVTRDKSYTREFFLDDLSPENLYVLACRGISHIMGNEAQSKLASAVKRADEAKEPMSDEAKVAALAGFRNDAAAAIATGNLASVREPTDVTDPFETRVRAKAELAVREWIKSVGAKTVRQSKEKGAPVGVHLGEGDARRFYALDDLIDFHLDNGGDTAVREAIETQVRAELKAEERAKAKAAESAKAGALGRLLG